MAVRIAGCCDSAEGAFTATRLYPATKSQVNAGRFGAVVLSVQTPPKPPKFRFHPVGRVLSPPRCQSRHTRRHGGSQAGFFLLYHFPVQPVEAALGIGQVMLRYHAVEDVDHIRFL